MKRLNTMFDVAFSLEHVGDPEHISTDVLIDALQKRVDYLRQNPQEAADAFGVSDSFEVEPLINDENREAVLNDFIEDAVEKMTTDQLRDYARSSMEVTYCTDNWSNSELEDLILSEKGRVWLTTTFSEIEKAANS